LCRPLMQRGMPEDERVQDRAEKRRRERTEHVESILDAVETDARERKYPVRSEELATEYADQPLDLPNETESVASAFNRLDEEYSSAEEVREGLYGALTGAAGGPEEYNEGRELGELDDADHE
jgi:hypothetical protein